MTIKQKHICAPWRVAGGKIGNCIVCGKSMNSQCDRTFRTDRLYHQFLKPKNIELEKLPLLVTKLYESGFIELYHNFGDDERYSETEKLTSRQHRDELFKIIHELI